MTETTLPHDSLTPYGAQAGTKKAQVARMFDAIAGRYDLLNHAFSLGIDILWRRRAIRMLRKVQPQTVLDLATGTADFALEAVSLNPKRIIGLDIAEQMLVHGRTKIAERGLTDLIELRSGDAEALPFADGEIDAITVGFGVRNFEHLERGLSEMRRVLREGGVAVVLEPATPTVFPLKQIFLFYFKRVVPIVGRIVCGDESAYTYLPASVSVFPNGPDFVNICLKCGFRRATWHPLTFGICSLYLLEK
jgi:demethylmenaquinone methyltransferase/2-methoxy-6-polyprenyl-1,4-benzoquinol methylase